MVYFYRTGKNSIVIKFDKVGLIDLLNLFKGDVGAVDVFIDSRMLKKAKTVIALEFLSRSLILRKLESAVKEENFTILDKEAVLVLDEETHQYIIERLEEALKSKYFFPAEIFEIYYDNANCNPYFYGCYKEEGWNPSNDKLETNPFI